MTDALLDLSEQIKSMQKTIDSQHATICQINRNGQAQLKKIQTLERMLKKKDKENEELKSMSAIRVSIRAIMLMKIVISETISSPTSHSLVNRLTESPT